MRFHESCELSFLQAAGFFPFQIHFTDHPDREEAGRRIEKVKEIYGVDTVYDAGGYVDAVIGVSNIVDGVRVLVLMVAMVIIVLVTVLMERSFIAKERGEIAILKAMVLMVPATVFSIGPIFRMMGASYGVKYEIVPAEVCLIYPAAVLAVTVVSAFFTALCTKMISASESAGIE